MGRLVELTRQHLVFCEEYTIDFNASKAYQRAGYPNANPHTAACRLLGDPLIQDQINRLLVKRSIEHRATVDRLIRDHLAIMDLPIDDLLTEVDGVWDVKPLAEWSAELKRITGFKGFNPKGQPQFVIDKAAARDDLAKIIGAYGDFNQAIGILRKYGVELIQDEDGNWSVISAAEAALFDAN
jgi:phage terminase small subunit